MTDTFKLHIRGSRPAAKLLKSRNCKLIPGGRRFCDLDFSEFRKAFLFRRIFRLF